jgi:hypothetical protein
MNKLHLVHVAAENADVGSSGPRVAEALRHSEGLAYNPGRLDKNRLDATAHVGL